MDRHISGKKDLPKRHTLKLSHFSERINVSNRAAQVVIEADGNI